MTVTRSIGVLACWVAVAVVLSSTASAQPSANFLLGHQSPCVVGSCQATVAYKPADQAVRVEVDFDHAGAPESGFKVSKSARCAPPNSADAVYTNAPAVCNLESSRYTRAGSRTVAIHVVGADGSEVYAGMGITVLDKPTKPTKPTRPKPSPGDAGCEEVAAGEICHKGAGKHPSQCVGCVPHKGWPPIYGVLWKVIEAGRGRHDFRGTAKNDELLGHHGNDIVVGGKGNDVLWGDWQKNNPANQRDVLRGGSGKDWLYPSHGLNKMYGGPGNDHIVAYYGHGTIDCGPGNDMARVRLGSNNYRLRNCERVEHFCAFGSDGHGGCNKPGAKSRQARVARRDIRRHTTISVRSCKSFSAKLK